MTRYDDLQNGDEFIFAFDGNSRKDSNWVYRKVQFISNHCNHCQAIPIMVVRDLGGNEICLVDRAFMEKQVLIKV